MGGEVSKLLSKVGIPKMFQVTQVFPDQSIAPADIPKTVYGQLGREKLAKKLRPGMRVAITAGSRGVANVALITKSIADFVKKAGAHPFVVPAMGSHGGATAEGQKRMLEGFGVTEEYCGCPIVSSMETVHIGKTADGLDVYIDKNAAAADGIIVSCRVKPHTAFRGEYESGIMKMMAIGLGKQYGAEQCHNEGFKYMAKNVYAFGKATLENAPVLFAVAAVENAYDKTSRIAAVDADEIEEEEPKLLKEAFSLMPRILTESCDVLVVDRIGKNYTGGGMDPNITGTWVTPYGGGGITSQRVAVLDVSDESHGNTHGVGMASATTRRLFDKIDYDAMYMNGITSNLLGPGRLPYIMDNAREAIQVCIATCVEVDKDNLRVVRIPNSLELRRIWFSEAYLGEMSRRPDVVIESEPREMVFDAGGNLF